MIAFVPASRFLPAVVSCSTSERTEAVGYAALAPLDSFLQRHRMPILFTTVGVIGCGLPLLFWLRFDFNPLNLRRPHDESVSTYLALKRTRTRRQRYSSTGAFARRGRRDGGETARRCPKSRAP